MKHFYSKAGKVFLGITCTVFTLIFLVSSTLAVILGSKGLFSKDKTALENSMNDIAGRSYAALVLSKYKNDFNADRMEKSNCCYGIIQGKGEDLDLTDDSIYLYHNFKGSDLAADYYFHEYSLNDSSEFHFSDKLINLGTANAINTYNTDMYVKYDIQGIGYDFINNKAYVFANDQFYELADGAFECSVENEITGTPNTNRIYSHIWDTNKIAWTKLNNLEEENSSEEVDVEEQKESADKEESSEEKSSDEESEEILSEDTVEQSADVNTLYINGKAYEPISNSVAGYTLAIYSYDGEGVLSMDNVADLSTIHSQLDDAPIVSLHDISTVGVYEEDPANINYAFVCFPDQAKLSAKVHSNDYYAQAANIVNTAESMKYLLPIMMVISFIIAVVSLVMFMCAAGHDKQKEEIVVGPVEKLPVDGAFAAAFILEMLALMMFAAGVSNSDRLSIYFCGFVCLVAYVFGMAVGLLFCSNLAVNVKLHRCWESSLFYKFIGKPYSKFKEELKTIRSTVKWTNRIWAIYIIVSVIEFFVIVSFDAAEICILWLIKKAVVAFVIHRLLRSYARIKETATKLAEGDTSAQVDLEGMPLFFEEHGKALNDIQSGINVALEERTKSERMKTELITNVSHDIKTPLTSIINYVDLLEKEDIDNAKANEYLEVLDRQSKRLKKLIEDLIEASKVSTGNIKFNMEKVNAVVLFNQSLGEFSDRLKGNNIEVVTSFPQNDIYLTADNRYLWRVFDNLMSNIVKYAQPGTRAYVDLNESDDKLCFVFRNTSKEELNISADELMERFVRGDRSRYTDGNGLGLSIARSLTEAMGGKMNVYIDGDLFKAVLEFNKI